MMEQSLIPQTPALPLTAQRTVKRKRRLSTVWQILIFLRG